MKSKKTFKILSLKPDRTLLSKRDRTVDSSKAVFILIYYIKQCHSGICRMHIYRFYLL